MLMSILKFHALDREREIFFLKFCEEFWVLILGGFFVSFVDGMKLGRCRDGACKEVVAIVCWDALVRIMGLGPNFACINPCFGDRRRICVGV